MRRLYLQIYAAFLLVGLVAVVGAAVFAGAMFGRPIEGPSEAAVIAAFDVAALAPGPDFDARFRAVAIRVDHDLTLRAPDGTVLASSGRVLPNGDAGPIRGRAGVGLRLRLPDGRTLAVARPTDLVRRMQSLVWMLALAGALAIGVHPVARRVTRRLEALEAAMARWGTGALDVRAPVEGRDEVASVARTFNEVAARVEALFEAQRRVLASASHELRSPLARLRMAVALLDDGSPIVADAVRDIEELDATVGDLLQVGRMQATGGPERPEDVALRDLAAEEVARVDGVARGVDRQVRGDPRLLRRLVRNLVENADRHGARPIEIVVDADGFEVLDRGPGVPEALRERIFEPFFRPPGHAEGRDGGVGLGLHLVREIARFHGGSVEVRPREGGGTRFVVRLPDDPPSG